jgi:hypothetical protein
MRVLTHVPAVRFLRIGENDHFRDVWAPLDRESDRLAPARALLTGVLLSVPLWIVAAGILALR